MKKSDFLKSRGSNKPNLELTPESCSNDGISRLTFTGDDGKEYNFRGKNFDGAVDAGLITETEEAYTVAKSIIFQIDGWDNVRVKGPRTPDEVK